MADEGADIIAIDICKQIETNPYPLATSEDLAETAMLVEKTGRRVVTVEADVRDREALRGAVESGRTELGGLDIVVANAGILPMGNPSPLAFQDAIDVDLIGVMNLVAVTLAELPEGSSIIVTGSTAGMMNNTIDNPAMGGGGAGYGYTKKTIISYVEALALQCAQRMIRVNAIHPTNVNTHLLHHEGLYKIFQPDLESPTREDAELAFTYFQAMPLHRARRHLTPGRLSRCRRVPVRDRAADQSRRRVSLAPTTDRLMTVQRGRLTTRAGWA